MTSAPPATQPLLVETRQDLVSCLTAIRQEGKRIALVPTMGALHHGHRALLAQARKNADHVMVSIFVNPLQFSPGEDYQRYPRTLRTDLTVCQEEGISVVFAPSPDGMYPDGAPLVTVDGGPLGTALEGAFRPGHFAGVLTVVAKLLNLIKPDVAVFGEKDYQQLVLVRRMVQDLDITTRILAAPTVRDTDGVAASSRNRFLTPDQRRSARALWRALRAGQDAENQGGTAVVAAAREVLSVEPAVELDYLELRAEDLGPPPRSGSARLLIAAHVGSTRLIDNVGLVLGPISHAES